MPSRSRLPLLGLALGLVLVVALAGDPCQAAEAQPLATVGVGETGLSLQPLVPYDFGLLIVAGGDGTVARRPIAAGESIHFSPVDSLGRPLADGVYRWELRLVTEPAEEVRRAAEEARKQGDHEVWTALEPQLAPVLRRLSGILSVENGVINNREAPRALDGGGVAELLLTSDAPDLVFQDTTIGDDDFSIGANGDALTIVREGVTDILTIKSGVVGLFTSAPDEEVELHITDGLPEIRLDGSSGVWDMRVSLNDFQIVDEDELFPPVVLEIEKTGSNYTLKFDGDGEFTGIVSDSSSRDLKRDLEPVAPAAVLETLSELPLYSWTYIKNPVGIRHLGPVAEDFHAAFGLGRDNKHISPLDTTGVALAAIQALADRLKAKDLEILELNRRMEALEQRAGAED